MFRSVIALLFLQTFASAVSVPRSPQGVPNLSLAGKNLRIQTLGDSITNGYQSTTNNGYRSKLYELLSHGNSVTMIGSQTAGDMKENQNEGHIGAVITQTIGNSMLSIDSKPNLILLHIGTNNANLPSMSTTTADLASLLDALHSRAPLDTTILIAKIVPSSTPATNNNIDTINSQIDSLVQSRLKASPNMRLAVVDMQNGDSAHDVTTEDLKDGLHPNDGGYEKMAYKWYGGIVKAGRKGWLEEGEMTTNV